MAQVIDVPGFGPTEFPDGMSDDEIVSAIKRSTTPAPTQSPPLATGFDPINIAGGVVEPIAKMATGFFAKPIAEIAGLASGTADVLSGRQLGSKNASEVKNYIQSLLTYVPQTQAGRAEANPLNFIPDVIGGAIGKAGKAVGDVAGSGVESLGGGSVSDPTSMAGMTRNALDEATVQAAQIGMVKGIPKKLTPAELEAQSVLHAARIDAAKLAVEKYGLSINPAVSNPSKMNATRVNVAGNSLVDAISRKYNETLVPQILKEDIGIPKETPMTSSAPFDAVRDAAGAAKRQIQPMTGLVDDGVTIAAINDLAPKSTIGMSAVSLRVRRLQTEAQKLIEKNPSGAEVIAEIETLRKAARKTYGMKEAPQQLIDIADANMGIANALEGMIERNLQAQGKIDLLADFRKGRETMAKSYVLENATNKNTGLVDPAIIAKMTAKDNALTGAFADIGRIAGNFPESLGVKPGASGGLKELAITHASRTGIGGGIGYGIGSLFGYALPGAAIGSLIGELGGNRYAHRLAENPMVQRAVAVPQDFRPMMGGGMLSGKQQGQQQ